MLELQEKETKNLITSQRTKIVEANQSVFLMLSDKMSAQEFELIPSEIYREKQPEALEILDDPTGHETAKLLTVSCQPLERDTPKRNEGKELEKTLQDVQERVMKSLSMLHPVQKEIAKLVLRKIEEAEDVSITGCWIRIGNRTTSIDATCFLYNMRQSEKHLTRSRTHFGKNRSQPAVGFKLGSKADDQTVHKMRSD